MVINFPKPVYEKTEQVGTPLIAVFVPGHSVFPEAVTKMFIYNNILNLVP